MAFEYSMAPIYMLFFSWVGILQLLKDKGLLPEVNLEVENIVSALDVDLQGAAASVASILREKGQSVDLVLESKPLKWYFLLKVFIPLAALF